MHRRDRAAAEWQLDHYHRSQEDQALAPMYDDVGGNDDLIMMMASLVFSFSLDLPPDP